MQEPRKNLLYHSIVLLSIAISQLLCMHHCYIFGCIILCVSISNLYYIAKMAKNPIKKLLAIMAIIAAVLYGLLLLINAIYLFINA